MRKNGDIDKNIDKLGVHFHRKTQNISEWNLKEELSELIEKETLELIDYINIGGGIPSKYKNFRIEVMNHIFEKIKELKQWLNENNIQIIIEPGRFIAAPSIELESTIKKIYNNSIVVNCSIYNSAMDTLVVPIRLLVKNELQEGEGEAYTIKGCTPDSMDIFRYRVYLKNPKIGDKIIFLNAGAYNYSTDFCNLPKLETVIVN